MNKVIMSLMLAMSMMTVGSTAYAGDAGDFLRIIGGIIDAADGDYDHSPNYGRRGGGYYCKAFDTGHEEHWGGHDNCRKCLRKHGNCVEKCYREQLECTLEGRDNYGYTREFRDTGQRRWRIKERLERRCRRAGYDSCIFEGCDREKYKVSQNRCRKYGRDKDRRRDRDRDRRRRGRH